MPIQAFAVAPLLAHMTMPPLGHPHHTVDSLDRPPGPHRVPQELIHLSLARAPSGAKPTTQDLRQDHHLLEPPTLVTLGPSHQPTQGPSMGQGRSPHGLRHRPVQLLMQTIHRTQGSCILAPPVGLTPGLPLELSARLVAWRLSVRSTSERTGSIHPPSRPVALLHRLVGVHRFLTASLRLAPGTTRPPCHPTAILATPLAR
jgi:hypothetical protein